MLGAPEGFDEGLLVGVLGREWGVEVGSLGYRAVGFGSHHWEVVDGRGGRWFVTVDELELKRHLVGEPLGVAFGRLGAGLGAAVDLRGAGRGFVVAPVVGGGGAAVVRMGERFAVALYPFVEGESFEWGDFSRAGHREAVLELVVGVHTGPRGRALVDDFVVPHRDELEAGLDGVGPGTDGGPYGEATAELLRENVDVVRRWLGRYDELVAGAERSRVVLTHGEPHPGNTMLTSDGWVLIDWETALLAPPERDLWGLDPGDGSVLEAYAEATGVVPVPSMLELYRVRWDLADLAIGVSRFREWHSGGPDDDKSWEILRSLVAYLGR